MAYRNEMPIRPDPDFRRDVERLVGALVGTKGRLDAKARQEAPRLGHTSAAGARWFSLRRTTRWLVLFMVTLATGQIIGETVIFKISIIIVYLLLVLKFTSVSVASSLRARQYSPGSRGGPLFLTLAVALCSGVLSVITTMMVSKMYD